MTSIKSKEGIPDLGFLHHDLKENFVSSIETSNCQSAFFYGKQLLSCLEKYQLGVDLAV